MPTDGSREQDEIVRKATDDHRKFTERECHRGQGADSGTLMGGSIMGSEEFREKHVMKKPLKKDDFYM